MIVLLELLRGEFAPGFPVGLGSSPVLKLQMALPAMEVGGPVPAVERDGLVVVSKGRFRIVQRELSHSPEYQ